MATHPCQRPSSDAVSGHRSGYRPACPTSTSICRPIAVVVLLCLVSVRMVGALQTAPPADAMAWYRFDPSRFAAPGASDAGSGDEQPGSDPDATRGAGGLLPSALLVLQRSGLIDPEVLPVIHAMVGASIAGSVPHSVCLLDLDLAYDETADAGVRVLTAQAVLVIETPPPHPPLLNALDGMLGHSAATTEGGRQSLITLPNGRDAGRFEVPAWGEWRTLEWASQPDCFLVGLGKGSLDRWIAASASPQARASIEASTARASAVAESAEESSMELQRAIADLARPAPGPRFVEMWLNLERIRARMPDILAQGRVREQLVTWQLDNARSWMVHGRWSGRFLLFDLTWQRMNEPRTAIAHRPLTIDRLPADINMPVPAGDFVIVAPVDHAAAFDRTIAAYRGLLSGERREAFDRAFEQWMARQRRVLPAVLGAYKPWLVISNVPRPPAPIPGACSVYFELKDGPSPRVIARQMDALMGTFIDLPAPEQLGDARIVRDERNDLQYLQIERTGLIRTPAWGWAGRVLVAGWGPPVVLENRGAMARP